MSSAQEWTWKGRRIQEDPNPQIVEIDDLDIPAPEPPPVDVVETVEQAEAPAAPDEPVPVAQPAETPGGRRPTRVRTQPKAYIPSMTGSKYSYAVTQLESQGVLNPDAHMFVQEGVLPGRA